MEQSPCLPQPLTTPCDLEPVPCPPPTQDPQSLGPDKTAGWGAAWAGPLQALGSQTCSSPQVKLWRLPAPGQALPSGPGLVLGPEDLQVEVLQFHPTADGVLLSVAGRALKVWDATQQQPLTGTGHALHTLLVCVFGDVNFEVRISFTCSGKVTRFYQAYKQTPHTSPLPIGIYFRLA